MAYKYFLEAEHGNKKFIQICNELKIKKECIIEDASGSEWHGVFRKMGRQLETNGLIKNGFIEPIWFPRNMRNGNSRLIRIGKNTDKIVEKAEKNNIKYFFLKKKP